MDSDSESQDSDDGRRFRFETTRKDGQSRRQLTPERDTTAVSRRRSRSRDRNQREERSSSRRTRSPAAEDRRDRRSHRSRDRRDQRQESRNGREHHRHKSKRDKQHKHQRSREKSSEEVKESSPVKPEQQQHHHQTDRRLEEEVNEARTEVVQSPPQLLASSNPGPPDLVVSDAMPAEPRTAITAPGPQLPPPPPARKKPLSYFERVVHRAKNDPDEGLYGPALPPQLEKRAFEENRAAEADGSIRQTIGPSLPPGFHEPMSVDEKSQEEDEEEEEDEPTVSKDEEDEEEVFGPALPPHLQRKVLGPMLPENFVPQDVDVTEKVTEETNEDEDEEDDDHVVGPLPADHPAAKSSQVQMQLEYRARKVKEKFMDKTGPEKSKREEWMVELPPAHAVALGLGSIKRKFKTREGPDMSDRSVWTDTPADRLRKQREKEENRFVPSQESNEKAKPTVAETTDEKEEPESLLDMHLKKMKKKKKKMDKEAKESGLPTRRPFDRDVDLQVNRLDDAKKKKIFDKARLLNDRFAPGKI